MASNSATTGVRSDTEHARRVRIGHLIYSAITSLDGRTYDERGRFDWAAPDAEVHGFINDLCRSIGTYLYGRRMYETMVAWETVDTDESSVMAEFAGIWQGADKIVYSTTLDEVASARTRIERTFDAEAVRNLKSGSTAGIAVGGANLAGEAMSAGLVDEFHHFIAPVIVGSGQRWLPSELRIDLDLVEEQRFPGGFVFLRYRTHR